jgi:hypothetical protein
VPKRYPAKLGKKYGVYPSTVRDALLRAGVPMRPRLVRGDVGAVDVDGEAPAIRSTSAPLRAGGGAIAA